MTYVSLHPIENEYFLPRTTKRGRLLFLREVERGSLPDRTILDLVVEALEELDTGEGAAERSLKHL